MQRYKHSLHSSADKAFCNKISPIWPL
jgi:hypothetical protein